jgi:hypothetical protein
MKKVGGAFFPPERKRELDSRCSLKAERGGTSPAVVK